MRNFIAGAGLLSVLNAIDLGRRNEASLYIRHVNSQEACDSFNKFNADRYEFNQEYCACFIREDNYPGRIAQCGSTCQTNPFDLDECIARCQMDEALDHGLDANCNIPRDENDDIHRHARGWHKHGRDTDCKGRVIHNYRRVNVAPEFEVPDFQTYINQQSQYTSGLTFDRTVAVSSTKADNASTEATDDEIVQDATKPDTVAEVDSDAQEYVEQPETEIVQDATYVAVGSEVEQAQDVATDTSTDLEENTFYQVSRLIHR